jgi:hypothetical protein
LLDSSLVIVSSLVGVGLFHIFVTLASVESSYIKEEEELNLFIGFSKVETYWKREIFTTMILVNSNQSHNTIEYKTEKFELIRKERITLFWFWC